MSCAYMFINSIFGNIFLATLIVFLFSTLVYMIGKLFNRPEYVEYAKTEYYNFFVTLALVFSFASIAGIAMQLSCSPNGADLFDQATSRLSNIIYGEIYPTLKNLFQIMLESSFISNFTINFSKGEISFVPGAGFKYFYASINVVSYILEVMFASIYIQSFLMVILKHTAFTILFPIGIFLRAFPMTRDAGTYIMALIFALYVAFPYFYVVSLDAYDQMTNLHTYESFSEEMYHSPTLISSYSRAVENAIFFMISAASYASIREMFFNIGAYLFIAVSVPALSIILSISLATSLIKFLKEVSA